MGKQKKKVTFAQMRNTKLGPLGACVLLGACTLGYLVFLKPMMNEYKRQRFENEANKLLTLRQLQDREEIELDSTDSKL